MNLRQKVVFFLPPPHSPTLDVLKKGVLKSDLTKVDIMCKKSELQYLSDRSNPKIPFKWWGRGVDKMGDFVTPHLFSEIHIHE